MENFESKNIPPKDSSSKENIEYKSSFTKFHEQEAEKAKEEIRKLKERAVEEIRKSEEVIKSNEKLKKELDEQSI